MEKKISKKNYIRYDEACDMYSMSITKLKQVAREADAVYKLNRLVLINVDKMDAYIRSFPFVRR